MHAAAEPHLELAAYEMPPEGNRGDDGEPFFFRALWFGSEREFVGQVLSSDENFYRLYFSLTGEPERGNFVCFNKSASGHPSCTPRSEFQNSVPAQRFVDYVENGFWGRLFVLDSQLRLANGNNGNCIVSLAASGWGTAHFLHQGSAKFQWNSPCASELAQPFSTLHLEQVLALAGQPEHPIQFAFQWARLPKLERFAMALPLDKGNYGQWQQLILLYATATVKSEEGWRSYHEVNLVSHAQSTWLHSNHGSHHIRGKGDDRTEENKSFRKFLLLTLAYFAPVRNEELCAKHPCVRSWLDHKPQLFSKSVEQSTRHERLEALFQLREWLADKATPEEIEALLSED